MANNLRVFNTNSEYQSADLVHPAVSYVVETDKVIYDMATPPFQGKWEATYSDGTVLTAQCDVSSAITSGEITLTNLVSLKIGNCVTKIGANAFGGCSTLTNLEISDSVTEIENRAFWNAGLTSTTIGSGVASIGPWGIYNKNVRNNIYIYATTPPTISTGMLNRPFASTNVNIYVPSELVQTYKSAWSEYKNSIRAIPTE